MDKIQILTELIEKASENLNRQRPDSEWKKEFEFLLKKVQLQDRLLDGVLKANEAIVKASKAQLKPFLLNKTMGLAFHTGPNSCSIYADPLKTVLPFKDKINNGK